MAYEAWPFDASIARDQLEKEIDSISASTIAHKRFSFSKVLGDSHPFDDMSEADLFGQIFGDRAGTKYWQWWFEKDKSPLYEFAEMLAAHNAKARLFDDRQDFLSYLKIYSPRRLQEGMHDWPAFRLDPLSEPEHNRLLNAFVQAAINKEPWLEAHRDRPDGFDDLLRGQFKAVRNSGLLVRRRSAAIWLANHSEFRDLLPASAKAYIIKNFEQAESVDAAPPGSIGANPKLSAEEVIIGRPMGSGYQDNDRRLFPIIENLLQLGHATSLKDAVRQIDRERKIVGGGTPESRIGRVCRLYSQERKRRSEAT